MCTTVGNDGSIYAQRRNIAVPEELLKEIHIWRNEGATDEGVLIRLRQITVPKGYTYHMWNPGLLLNPYHLAMFVSIHIINSR